MSCMEVTSIFIEKKTTPNISNNRAYKHAPVSKNIKMKSRIIYSLLLLLLHISVFAREDAAIEGANSGSINGRITDKADTTAIVGATVYIPDLRVGTTTDVNGAFHIDDLPKGTYLIQISNVGYATLNQKVNTQTAANLEIQLSQSRIEAGEVVITGVSKATEIKRDPVPMLAVGKAYIQEHAAAGNVIDQIANLPGVSAVSTGPNVSKPFIRGLGYNRVVTAQDGIRQEGQQWGDEHGIEVDQNSIDRVEVIKGPASLSFGPDAIGGVVNLITPSPLAEGNIAGALTGVYGTNNGLMNGSLKLQGNNNGFVWGAVLSSKQAKNYQNDRDGRVYGTNFKEKDARVMFGLNKSWGYSHFNVSMFDDKQAIPDGSRDSLTRKFTRQITEEDEERPIVPQSDLNSYALPTLHQRVQLYRIYNNSSFHLGNGNLLLNLGYQYSHRREYTHPTQPDIPGLNLELSSYTYDAKYNFNIGDGYETTVGINGMYQNNVLGNSTSFPIPAYTQFDIGPFIVVKKNFGKLDVSAGARYDTRSFNGKAAYVDNTDETFPSLYTGPSPETAPNVSQQFPALKKTFSGASGSAGASYNFSEKFLVKANIATGFRSPSIAELSANGPDPGSQIYHVGNSDFKPEYSVQGDVGAFLTLPNVTASAELFANNIENYIFQQQVVDANGVPVLVDANGTESPNGIYNKFTFVQTKARILGGEFNLDIHPLPWLHFENSLALTYGTNLGSGGAVPDSLKYLPFIPPVHTHSELRADYDKGFGRFKHVYAFAGFDHFAAQDRYFSAYGTETYTAGYNLLSAGIGGALVNKAGKKLLELYVEGTNLGNTNYQSNMSRLKYFDNPSVPAGVQPGIFNMGRNISFRLVVPFGFSTNKEKGAHS